AIFGNSAGREPGPKSWQRFGRAGAGGWRRKLMRGSFLRSGRPCLGQSRGKCNTGARGRNRASRRARLGKKSAMPLEPAEVTPKKLVLQIFLLPEVVLRTYCGKTAWNTLKPSLPG